MEYRTDQEVYKKPDYWATVREMITDPETQRLMDDCDGFTGIKYDKMKEAGCPVGELSWIICLYTPNQTGHMVCAWWEDPDDPWVMDIPGVELSVWKLSERSDLRPLYAFNENSMFEIRQKGVSE